MGALRRARIRGEGTSEVQWRPWLARVALPALELPLAPTSDGTPPRLVVLAPHPDDEVLACGGLIRRHLREGGQVLVIAATDGEKCHGRLSAKEGARLAALRRRERRRGLSRLVANPLRTVCLRLPDGGLREHEDSLYRSLDRHACAGDVIVSTWQADGHPDHEACGRVAARWCEEHGHRLLQAPVWMWHWAAPDDPRIPWERLATLPLDAASVAAKDLALRAHHSQHRASPHDGRPILGPAIVARNLRPCEYYLDASANLVQPLRPPRVAR